MKTATPWQRTLVTILTLFALFIPWLGGCGPQKSLHLRLLADAPPSAPAAAPRLAEAEFATAEELPEAHAEAPRPAEAAFANAVPPPARTAAPRPAGASRAVTSATPLTKISAIDAILDSLAKANIAFNAPRSMNLMESAQIQLLLSLEQSVEDLQKMLTQAGDKEGAQIQVSDRMEAHLTGQNFQITATTPEEQAITSKGVTEWKWDVKPTISGRHSIHLTLTALLAVEGHSTRRAIRTFDKVIEVNVTWPQQISRFVANNWQWLWAVILLPLSGWLWKKRKSGGA